MITLLFALWLHQPAYCEDKILYIGDSHTVGPMGEMLVKLFKDNSQSLQRYGIVSASAKTWLKPFVCPAEENCPYKIAYVTPTESKQGRVPADFPGLSTLLEKLKPVEVVVALGTNDAYAGCKNYKNPKTFQNMDAILQKVKDLPCTWVGPTIYKTGSVIETCGDTYFPFVDELKKHVEAANCKFIDSREFKRPDGSSLMADAGDKVHFKTASGQLWAKLIFAEYQTQNSGSTNEPSVDQ